MPIQPKGIILHSMSEYLMWKGQKLYAKDFLKALGLSVHGFIKPDGTYDKMKKFNIPASRVVRHSDVSGDHVRGKGKGKVDPGNAFNWKAFQRALVA